jgi:hypothetical protein
MADIGDSDRIKDYLLEVDQSIAESGRWFGKGRTLAMGIVESKIRDKSEQAAACCGVPYMLVMPMDPPCVHNMVSAVEVAMFGWPGLRVELGNSNSPMRPCRTTQGKMTNPKWPKNNCVSAIGLIHEIDINHYRSGLARFTEKAFSQFQIEVAWSRVDAEEKRLNDQGRLRGNTAMCLAIYLNPFATNPWPLDLIGEFDQVYVASDVNGGFRLTIDGRNPNHEPEFRKSQSQLDIETLIANPLLRNSG